MPFSAAKYDMYVYSTNCFMFYTLVNVHRGESSSPVCLDTFVEVPTSNVVVVATRASVLISDILLVAATWYYVSRTSSVREHLVRGVWDTRPSLTTVIFRDGEY